MKTEPKNPRPKILVSIADMAQTIGTDERTLTRLLLTGQLRADGVFVTKDADTTLFFKDRSHQIAHFIKQTAERQKHG